MEKLSPYRRKYEAIFIFRSGEIHLMRIRGLRRPLKNGWNLQLVIRLLNRVRVSPMSEQFSYNTTQERGCSNGTTSVRASSRVLL
jgi:hypothetical protein